MFTFINIPKPAIQPLFPSFFHWKKCDNIIICQLALQKLKRRTPGEKRITSRELTSLEKIKRMTNKWLRAQEKILIKGAKNCGKNEPTSVSITKLQKQASISLNNGAWPNPRSGNLRLLLNPLRSRGVDKYALAWGEATVLTLHYFLFFKNISITMLWLFIMLGTHRKLILEDENVYAGAGRRQPRGNQSASSEERFGSSRTCWRTTQSREIIKHINDHKGGLKELNAFNAGDCRSVALVPVENPDCNLDVN